MPASVKYPDAVRQQAVALSLQGKGYKAIASALGLPRDTVRNWITIYRLTGRQEAVQTTGHIRKPEPQKAGQKALTLTEREQLYAPAREEYEQGSDSLLAIAQKHGLNYANLRNFLQQYHPESSLLHSYAKSMAQLQAELEAQMNALQEKGDELQRALREELASQLQRLEKR